MDTLVIMSLFPYTLSLLIVLPLLLFFFGFRERKANAPPGSSGWPVVGESIKFVLSGPQQFITERRKKYSEDVFRTRLFGQQMAVFCGARGNKFVFTKLFTPWWPLSTRKVLFFPEFTDSDVNQVNAVMHSFVHDILKPEALKQYIPVMDLMAREHVELEWDGKEVVKVHPLAKKYTFELAFRLFVNVVDLDHVNRLFEHFTRFKLVITNPREKIVFHSFPVPTEGLPLHIIRHKT